MKSWTVLALLVAGAALVWIAVGQMPDGRLHVFLLDVDGGQGVIVRTASGSVALIDGGSSPSVLLTALGRCLPFWQRSLRAVIATEQSNSAVAPLMDASQRYDIGFALGPPAGSRPGAAYDSWRSILQEHRVPLVEAQAGMVIDLADGTLIEITDVASTTLALRISYGDTSLLLPGQRSSLPLPLDATIVAIPLPSKSTPGLSLAETVQAVVFFTGSQSGQSKLLPPLSDVTVYSTQHDGTLELVSDGVQVEIRPHK